MDIFNQIFELVQAGNYGGAWTMFLGSASTLIASIGGAYGIIALINKGISVLSGNKKLLKRIKDNTQTTVQPLGTAINEFKGAVDKTLAELKESLQNEFKGEIETIKELVDELNKKQDAFAGTVLDSEQLSLKYENNLKQIELTAKEEIKEIVVEKIEEVKSVAVEETNEAVEEIKEVVVKKKNKKVDIEYV